MKIVYEGTAKERLDKFLQGKLPISRSKIQKLIEDGEIKVNKESVPVHHFLKNGEAIEYNSTEIKEISKPKKFTANPDVKFKVVFEDDNYLIIDKPSGLMVHPTDLMEDHTLANGLIAKYPKLKKVGDDPVRPGIVHRLDKDVSGLILVAKNQKSFDYYKKLFQDREMHKVYTALVHGTIAQPSGEINFSISRSKTKSGRMAAHPSEFEDGKEAITKYELIEQYNHLALLKVEILTGRTHQIRVHMNAIGHPVVGDRIYTQKSIKRSLEVSRTFLHSTELSFVNQEGEKVEYKSKLPKELQDTLDDISTK